MVHQLSVNAAIAVLKAVDKDETEGQHGGGDDWIKLIFRRMIERDWSADQGGDIFVARADMIRDRSLRLAVVVADETSFGTEAELHEALIADRDALHA